MKKRTVVFTLVAGLVYIGTTSYHGGAAADGSLNRTGAQGSTAGCAGSGCHTGTAPTSNALIYIDSAGGIPVTKYTPGKTYTIRVVGKHSANDEFGFQFAAVSGIGSSQVQAGTFGTSLPANVAKHTLSGLDLIEHTDHVAAVSPADSFVRSFSWTAPATSVGNITLYLSVNAVNGNHMADPADVSSNSSKVLQPYTVPSTVSALEESVSLVVYPNPVKNSLNVTLNGQQGHYLLNVFDFWGRLVLKTNFENGQLPNMINTAQWKPGIYQVVVEGENGRVVNQVVKND